MYKRQIIDCVPDIKKKREEFNIPANKRIIISVCELSYRKNCETMIRAFIKADRDDTVLLMCGIGAQMDMLKELVDREGVADKVIFAGFREDIIELFKIADMFMFTSRPVSYTHLIISGGIPPDNLYRRKQPGVGVFNTAPYIGLLFFL